eukprot:IDg1075t1
MNRSRRTAASLQRIIDSPHFLMPSASNIPHPRKTLADFVDRNIDQNVAHAPTKAWLDCSQKNMFLDNSLLVAGLSLVPCEENTVILGPATAQFFLAAAAGNDSSLKLALKALQQSPNNSPPTRITLFMPVFDRPRKHWGCVLGLAKNRTVIWGDSLNFGPPSPNLLSVVKNVLERYTDCSWRIDSDNYMLDDLHLARQSDSTSCGMYVVVAAASLANNTFYLFSRLDFQSTPTTDACEILRLKFVRRWIQGVLEVTSRQIRWRKDHTPVLHSAVLSFLKDVADRKETFLFTDLLPCIAPQTNIPDICSFLRNTAHYGHYFISIKELIPDSRSVLHFQLACSTRLCPVKLTVSLPKRTLLWQVKSNSLIHDHSNMLACSSPIPFPRQVYTYQLDASFHRHLRRQ